MNDEVCSSFTSINILPVNSDISIAVNAQMFVVEAERVHEAVHQITTVNTMFAKNYSLASADSANVCPRTDYKSNY